MGNAPIFSKIGITSVTVKWRIMNIQPKLGCGLGRLPGLTIFMSSFKKIYQIHQQLIPKQVFCKGGCCVSTIDHLDQKNNQDTWAIGTNYTKVCKLLL